MDSTAAGDLLQGVAGRGRSIPADMLDGEVIPSGVLNLAI